MKTYIIRQEIRQKAQNYSLILATPSDAGNKSASGTGSPATPRRLEATVKPPSELPYSGKYKVHAYTKILVKAWLPNVIFP